MSLLLQALQKAAKTRESTGGEPELAPAAPDTAVEAERDRPLDELMLEEEEFFEPHPAPARGEFARTGVEPTLELEPALEISPDDDFDPEPQPPARASALRSVRPLNAGAASSEQAATIMRASETRSTGLLDWVRDRPVYAFAALALIFLVGYGGYVYLQIAHPGILRGNFGTKTQLKPKSPPPNPATPAVVQPTPAPGVPGVTGVTAATAEPSAAAGGVGPSGAPQTPPIAGLPLPPDIPAAAAAGTGANNATRPPPAAAVRAPGTSRARQGRPTGAPGLAARENPPQREARNDDLAAATLEDTVDVRRAGPQPVAPLPSLTDAWNALQQGRQEQAQALYESVLVAEPQNVDAMIGLAAIATQRGANDAAARYFERALELEPHNTAAQAGLISILGQADLQLSETRLKDLISREPSGSLYFALGNFYTRQGLWAAAQQAYFQAYQMHPENSDYAYNLAVALEHLGQPKIALGYYRKALELASLKGLANFDRNRVRERIGQLAARLSSE